MKKYQQGFTLIELMIVVAIIAILAAIALPAYQDYVARSQVSEAMSLASGAKTAVAEKYADTGDFAGIDNAAAGLADADEITGKYVESVTVADGVITVEFNDNASAKINQANITLTPEDEGGSISWTCGGSVENKYLPSSCRQ